PCRISACCASPCVDMANRRASRPRRSSELVGNLIPTVILTGPSSGVPGQPLHYTGSFIDSDPEAWAGTVNFGDGTGNQVLVLNREKTYAVDHEFAVLGACTVTLTDIDNPGR